LLQDRLAKLTAYAAQADVIMDAVAQDDVRVAPVAQWLQRQAVGVPEQACSPTASSDGWSVTVRASLHHRPMRRVAHSH